MKLNMNIKNTGIALMLVGALASCKTDLDINVDPNNPTLTTAQPNLILPSALQTTANIYNRNLVGDNNFRFASIWMGHAGFSGNYFIGQETNNYTLTTQFGEGTWTNCYDNNADYDLVQKLGKSKVIPFYEGIGKVMKAYNFQTLVDLYNNVPYSEALQGAVVPTPKYDNGKDVYEGILKDVEDGIALINSATPGTVGNDDIMFKGDKVKWAQFANTVKLRMLLRQSERSERSAYITSKIATIQTPAGATSPYLTADATINPGYLDSDGKQNGFWRSCHTPTGTYNQDLTRGGAYVINVLKANIDPRLSRLFKPLANGTYVGCQLGAANPANSGSSEFGLGLLKNSVQNSLLITVAESYFLQAEAVVRGWISGDAKALYTAGVNASFNYLGATGADTYMAQIGNKNTNWDATTSTTERIALIIRQKYIALTATHSLESYNDYRRLGLPSDVSLSPVAGSNKIPNRLMFPQREYNVNGTQVLTQGTINPQVDKIWWMK
ncbi:MAG: SusD/RagB family nutrient-binding outer membrane lipoprotein [Ferruginibacter sp.]|nr:SusD/RagB family nutrient-binding outer membrane lipoprotein [Ferruginibacter sp.]